MRADQTSVISNDKRSFKLFSEFFCCENLEFFSFSSGLRLKVSRLRKYFLCAIILEHSVGGKIFEKYSTHTRREKIVSGIVRKLRQLMFNYQQKILKKVLTILAKNTKTNLTTINVNDPSHEETQRSFDASTIFLTFSFPLKSVLIGTNQVIRNQIRDIIRESQKSRMSHPRLIFVCFIESDKKLFHNC